MILILSEQGAQIKENNSLWIIKAEAIYYAMPAIYKRIVLKMQLLFVQIQI